MDPIITSNKKQTNKQTSKQTNIQTNKQTNNKQTNKQTNNQNTPVKPASAILHQLLVWSLNDEL